MTEYIFFSRLEEAKKELASGDWEKVIVGHFPPGGMSHGFFHQAHCVEVQGHIAQVTINALNPTPMICLAIERAVFAAFGRRPSRVIRIGVWERGQTPSLEPSPINGYYYSLEGVTKMETIRKSFSSMWEQLEAAGEAERVDAVSENYKGIVLLLDGALATATGKLTYGNRYGNSWGPLTVILPSGQSFRTDGVTTTPVG